MDNRNIKSAAPKAGLGAKKVLVIDDNAILLRTVREMLGEKYQVSIAATGAQAFNSISKSIPDIILLDYEMPYENGEDILRRIRNTLDVMNVPVVFFTGSADREVVTKLISLNPAGYLLKPPNKAKMIEKIEKTLNPVLEEEEEEKKPAKSSSNNEAK